MIFGCDETAANDSRAKTEYSILQSYEFDLRNTPNTERYLIFRLNGPGNYEVIALPLQGQPIGYVVILARSLSDPKIKFMPERLFVLSLSSYTEIKNIVSMSSEIESFLIDHLSR
jgi:hypothetical protein